MSKDSSCKPSGLARTVWEVNSWSGSSSMCRAMAAALSARSLASFWPVISGNGLRLPVACFVSERTRGVKRRAAGLMLTRFKALDPHLCPHPSRTITGFLSTRCTSGHSGDNGRYRHQFHLARKEILLQDVACQARDGRDRIADTATWENGHHIHGHLVPLLWKFGHAHGSVDARLYPDKVHHTLHVRLHPEPLLRLHLEFWPVKLVWIALFHHSPTYLRNPLRHVI